MGKVIAGAWPTLPIPGTPGVPTKPPPPPAGPIDAIKRAIERRKAELRSEAITWVLVAAAVYYWNRDR